MGRRLNLQDPHDITSTILVLNIIWSCLLWGAVIILRLGWMIREWWEDWLNTKSSAVRRANKTDRVAALEAIHDLISEPDTFDMLTHHQ